MNISKYFYAGLFGLASLSPLAAQQATSAKLTPSGADITQMVLVDHPGNLPDDQGHGHVSVPYLIGAYEWTVQDWTKMLNAIASNVDPVLTIADPHHLWNEKMSRWIARAGNAQTGYYYQVQEGSENLPITNVSILSCKRACNYTQNKNLLPLSSGNSFDTITEHGAYEISKSSTDDTESAYQNSSAKCILPTHDQWVKSAFYNPENAKYFMYATRSNTNPGDAAGSVLDNRANYNLWPWAPTWLTGAPQLGFVSVDAFGSVDANGQPTGTFSPFGCYGMAGNVNDWIDTGDDTQYSNGEYIVLGGDYTSEYYKEPGIKNYLMRTCPPLTVTGDTISDTIGFRMVAKYDPASSTATSHGYGASDSASYSGWNPLKHYDQLTTAEQIALPTAVVTSAAGATYAAGLWSWEFLSGSISACFTSIAAKMAQTEEEEAEIVIGATEPTASAVDKSSLWSKILGFFSKSPSGAVQ